MFNKRLTIFSSYSFNQPINHPHFKQSTLLQRLRSSSTIVQQATTQLQIWLQQWLLMVPRSRSTKLWNNTSANSRSVLPTKKQFLKSKQFAGAIRQHSSGPPRKFNRVQGIRCQRHCTPEGSGTRPSEAIWARHCATLEKPGNLRK